MLKNQGITRQPSWRTLT